MTMYKVNAGPGPIGTYILLCLPHIIAIFYSNLEQTLGIYLIIVFGTNDAIVYLGMSTGWHLQTFFE